MPYSWKNAVNFYKDCFAADNRDQIISSILRIDQTLRFIFDGIEELLIGALPRVPIPNDLGQTLYDKSQQYFREKQLVYGTLFIAGRIAETDQKICAPLIFAQAGLESENSDWYIRLASEATLNVPIIKSLASESADVDALEAQFDSEPLFAQKVYCVHQWLVKNANIPDMLSALSYPKLCMPEQLVKYARARSHLVLCASAAIFLTDRSRAAQGICHALEAIVEDSSGSRPLRRLFDSHYSAGQQVHWVSQRAQLPVLLSQAQAKTLDIAASHDLGVISGPPGTGKSFTIAALIADRVLSGEKVLVVSETEPALEVIASKLASKFAIDDGVVRAGKQSYLVDLKRYLNDLITLGIPTVDEGCMTSLRTRVDLLIKKEAALARQYEQRSKRAMRRGSMLSRIQQRQSTSLINHIALRWVNSRITRDTNMRDILESIYSINTQREQLAREYIATSKKVRIGRLLNNHRQELVKFNHAIRARSSLRQQQTFDSIDYGLLLEAFPVWLVSLASLHKVLPLTKELFDLVVFDEASQCNIAASIPALYRAKRALIVGDAKQLRHLSFLPKSKEHKLRENHGVTEVQAVSYRSSSILDYASEKLSSQESFSVTIQPQYRKF